MEEDAAAKVASYAQKLSEGVVDGEIMSKRTKKRILQKLGKLKKQLVNGTDIASTTDTVVSSSSKRTLEESGYASPADETGNKIQKNSQNDNTLSKKELKVKLRLLNQELSDYAQKKQLKLAKKKIQWAINKGYKLDVHTYTNLINVHVRCNDMEGASEVLSAMKEKLVQPNLITFTTLMKGYCESGRLDKSRDIFFNEMNKEVKSSSGSTLRPNVRSLNTLLRGCARVGAAKSAYKAYSYFNDLPIPRANAPSSSGSKRPQSGKLSKSSEEAEEDEEEETEGYHPDASTFEYLVGILCRSGRVSAAETVVQEFSLSEKSANSNNKSAGGVDVLENAAIYLSLAKAYALAGDLQQARTWLGLSGAAMKMTQNLSLKENMKKRFQQSAAPTPAANSAKEKESKDKSGHSKSVALFLSHRRAEIQNEVQVLEDFIAVTESAAGSAFNASARDKFDSMLTQFLSQVLYFGFDGHCDFDTALLSGDPDEAKQVQAESAMHSVTDRLVVALRDKFGLKSKHVNNSTAELPLKMSRSVAASGFIQFEELFSQFLTSNRPVPRFNPEDASDSEDDDTEELVTHEGPLPPIKLEICSGNGEWVVAQAAVDRGAFTTTKRSSEDSASSRTPRTPPVKALWVALELRCDRVHNTLANHLFCSHDLTKTGLALQEDTPTNRNNLAIIGGDAAKILPTRFPPARLSAVFINHPQPPEQRSSTKDNNGKNNSASQGTHLLTVEFFREIHRILTAEGTITIVTDNQPYAKLLADSLAEMAQKAIKSANPADRIGFVSKKLPSDPSRSLQESVRIPDVALVTSAAATTAGTADKKSSATSSSQLSVDVWRGEPGAEAGHIAQDASSYFDRMWDLGQKKRRWFLFLKKV